MQNQGDLFQACFLFLGNASVNSGLHTLACVRHWLLLMSSNRFIGSATASLPFPGANKESSLKSLVAERLTPSWIFLLAKALSTDCILTSSHRIGSSVLWLLVYMVPYPLCVWLKVEFPVEQEAMLAFRSGKAQIMVATDVAGRGLHIKGLPYVVNYDFPSSIEQYIHRAGRTGRLALHGHCFSFFTRNLAPIAQPIMDLLQAGVLTSSTSMVLLCSWDLQHLCSLCR